MASDLIKVCVFGVDKARLEGLKSMDLGKDAVRAFEVQARADDSDLQSILLEFRPHVIVSVGKLESFKKLDAASIDVRKRWVHYPELGDLAKVAEDVMRTFVGNAAGDRFPQTPLVSVFTPTYKTGERIRRPLNSLLEQSYPNWEWVIYDDSPDGGATFNEMCRLAKQDQRINVFRGEGHLGVIGEVKRRACGLCRGTIMVELDHDDELTRDALGMVVQAFQKFPDAGFAYTDCAETFENGNAATYPEGWGFGFGSYRTELYKGRSYAVTNYPGLNAKTVRHIVGMPNHLRAWKKDAYIAIGGHSADVHVADDYEVLIRTFLKTRVVHIQGFGYIQYYNTNAGTNTQRERNAEIQRLVAYFAAHYNQQIHARFMELGVDDFIWRDGRLEWGTPNPRKPVDANYVWKPY